MPLSRSRRIIYACIAVTVVFGLIFYMNGNSSVQKDVPEMDEKELARFRKHGNNRLAVLVYGVRMDALFETGKTIMKYVVEETDADVFVYGREVPEYNTTGAVVSTFGKHLKGMFLGKQLDEDEVTALLKVSKRFNELESVCKTSNMIKPGTLNGLIWGQRTMELAASYERAQLVRFPHLKPNYYTHMVFMRPDMEWLAPFPPLRRLASQHQMWIPTRTPWGGIPASCIVCPRDLCTHWGDLWERIRDGTMVQRMQEAGALTSRNCAMSEMFEYHYWKSAQVPMGWFSVVYAIVCAQGLCENGDQCYLGKSICAKGQRYKYTGQLSWFEAELALHNAKRIHKNGWLANEFRYVCYTTPEMIRKFRKKFEETGKEEMLYIKEDSNALHIEPPWSPIDGL